METQKTNPNPPDVSPEDGPLAEAELRITALTAERDALAAERDAIAAEKSELEDRVLRARAEFENFRRRSEQAKVDYFQFAAMELVRQLLPVLDDFERAIQVETSDRTYSKGIELIHQRLFDLLKKSGLEAIETVGQRFDPNIHEAVQRVETEEAEDQSILRELQRGYNFKGKLLRPAWVQVAVKP